MMLSPRSQSGLEVKILASASASKLWPRPRSRGFGLDLASISLSYYVIGHFSCKNRVKFGNFVNFSGNNLKAYVVNHYLVLFHNYFWPQPRPRPRPHSPVLSLGLGLGLVALASASAWASASKLGLGLSLLGLEVLASFNITDRQKDGRGVALNATSWRAA